MGAEAEEDEGEDAAGLVLVLVRIKPLIPAVDRHARPEGGDV